LSGKHADERSPRPSRRSLPLLAGTAVVAVLVGTTVAAMRLTPTSGSASEATATTRSVATSASPSSDRTQERADRSEVRVTEAPLSTPSEVPTTTPPTEAATTKPPAKPTTKPPAPPTPPAGGGSVVDSGSCKASFYTDQGSLMANGKPFDVNQLWAAHKTLKFGTVVKVTNTANGKSVNVTIFDRGPFTPGRCLDLTPRAFDSIASRSAGVITVKYEVLSG
jgi:rare lipoprotein A